MTKKRWKRVMALIMALVLTVGAAIPTAVYANADGTDADAAVDIDGDIQADMEPEPALYDETAGTEVQMEHIYGPDDGEGKFVTFLIRSMQNGVQELDLTDGIQIRDFIYVEDAVSAYLAVLEHMKELSGYCHFEVGTGISHTVRELVETIRAGLGAETRLNFGKRLRTESEIMFSTAQVEHLMQLGWEPKQLKIQWCS